MTIWKPTSVSEVGGLRLDRWSIYEVPNKDGEPTYHFVGVNLTEGGEGRVSSAIQTFDPRTMTGVTASGRAYFLVGDGGTSMDAMYVWSAWKRINKVEGEKLLDLETFCSKISTPRE